MKKYIKEMVGVLLLVLISCGVSSVTNTILATSVNLPGAFTVFIISFTFGLSYYLINYLINDELCTYNPLFTICDMFNKNIKIKEGILRILFQILGGIGGTLILGIILGNYGNLGASGFGENSIIGADMYQVLILEIIASMILVNVFLKDSLKNYRMNTALTITLLYIFTVPFDNGGLNPARSIGPALIIGKSFIKQLWVFIIAPVIGSILGYYLNKLLKK